MHPFAALLRRLRAERRLTQQDLASLAGVSIQSIARTERLGARDELPIRRSTHSAILAALASREPSMTSSDVTEFFRAAGITPLTEIAAATEQLIKRAEDGARAADPMTETAYRLLQAMISVRGAEKVVEALEAMCAAWSMDPPPRVSMPLPVEPPGPKPAENLPAVPGALKVVKPDGSVIYEPLRKPNATIARKGRTS